MIPSLPEFIQLVLSEIDAPYIWDGKGELIKGQRVFDCSGYPTWAFYRAGGPDYRATHNAKRLFTELKPVNEPRAGTLCFYGEKDNPEHVAIHIAEGVVVEAGGGDRKTTTLDLARAKCACVKVKSTYLYRPDFIGFRELPFL
jgi:cell wall-associated NlpC family hydrolase